MRFLIDPHSAHYDNNRFFDLSDANLNRDNGLAPYEALKRSLEEKGLKVSTFDIALNSTSESFENSYYLSFGRMRDFDLLKKMKVIPYGFVIMEPPLISSEPYQRLPELTHFFQNVFIHNTHGNGYDTKGVNQSKLKKLFWPQPYNHVLDKFWSNTQRANSVVMINGQHRPKKMFDLELYSQRITWSLKLNKYIPVKIYGRGWDKIISSAALWPHFLFNYLKIQKIYQGPCQSKFEVMSKFDFALCFENLIMDGYITEKIFDCFYSGVVPIYWGGDDITKWIPEDCYIDVRKFENAQSLAQFLISMPVQQKSTYRQNAKSFLASDASLLYYDLYKSLNLNQIDSGIKK